MKPVAAVDLSGMARKVLNEVTDSTFDFCYLIATTDSSEILNNTFCNRKQIGFISIDTIPYRFTRSFSSFPALKNGNFLGLIGAFSPVFGFMPT